MHTNFYCKLYGVECSPGIQYYIIIGKNQQYMRTVQKKIKIWFEVFPAFLGFQSLNIRTIGFEIYFDNENDIKNRNIYVGFKCVKTPLESICFVVAFKKK